MNETCKNCKYGKAKEEFKRGTNSYHCYFMPPRWESNCDGWGINGRPEVKGDDFCSQWKAKPQTE